MSLDIVDLINNSDDTDESGNESDLSNVDTELADQSEQSFEQSTSSFSQSSTSSSQSNDTRQRAISLLDRLDRHKSLIWIENRGLLLILPVENVSAGAQIHPHHHQLQQL